MAVTRTQLPPHGPAMVRRFRTQAPTAHQTPDPTASTQPMGFTRHRCVDSQGIGRELRGDLAKLQPEIGASAERPSRDTVWKPRQPCGSERVRKRREEFCVLGLVVESGPGFELVFSTDEES
jgi:hypothetical protein